MSVPWEDEETWDDTVPPVREPLEIRIQVRDARPRSRPEHTARLLGELWQLPAGERTEGLRESRFHDVALLERLLEECHGALPYDVDRAVELATLAVELGSLLVQRGEMDRDEALSRALCLAGAARRLVGDVAVADAAFEQAGRLALTPAERGFFCRSLALLRWDQGRGEEAIALLQLAGQRFAESHGAGQRAVCRALLGLLHLEQGVPELASPLLAQASLDLDGDLRPWLAAQTWLGLSFCYAAQERKEKSRSARQRASDLSQRVEAEEGRLSLRWQEGRSAGLAGDRIEAGDLLEGVRREAIRRRWLPEAALVTLDMGFLEPDIRPEARQGREEEIAAAFAGNPALDLALGALRHQAEDLQAGRRSREIWLGTAAMLRLAFRLQGVPPRPVPFA